MRSAETGRPQIVATNNGISAFIDAKGRLIGQAPSFKTYVLTQNIKGQKGNTPFTKIYHKFGKFLAF